MNQHSGFTYKTSAFVAIALFVLAAISAFAMDSANMVRAAPADTPVTLPADYFVPQVFSSFASTTAGTLAGNAITVSTGGSHQTNSPRLGAYPPGSSPANLGFPSASEIPNSGVEFGSTSGGTNATVNFQFANALTKACHIFVDDVDFNMVATLQFFDAGGTLLDPSAYILNNVSATGLPTVEKTPQHIKFTGIGGSQSEPTWEIIPSVNTIRRIEATVNTGATSSIAMYFTCSQPPLSKAFSPANVQQGQVSTLTFDISSINGNPIEQAGFVDTLPSGLQVANPANTTNTCGNGSSVTASPGGSSVSFSGLTLAYDNSLASCTISVDVINKSGQTNASCAANPAAFTNDASNITTSTLDTSALASACLEVTLPSPLPTNYFVPQVFSEFSSTSAGSLAGNNITVSTTGTIDQIPLKLGAYTPGNLPPNSGFPSPSPANSGMEWGSSSSTSTVAFEFANPLSPACHILIDDVDFNEVASLEFYDAGGSLINPSGFLVNPISTAALPTFKQTATSITFIGLGSGQSEPTHEIIPDVATVSKIVVTGTNSVSTGSIAAYFTCSQPPLSKTFSPSSVQQDEVSTLTFDINSIHGNPIWEAEFVDTLPSGLQVANPANTTNTCDNGSNVTASPGGSSVSFSGLTLAYNNGMASCSISVDVLNKSGQSNASCDTNPVAFTNKDTDVATLTLNTEGLSACLVVLAPGKIIVDKVTSPSSDPQSFDFSLTGGPDSINQSFSLADATTPHDSGDLKAGTYALAETVPSGWTLTDSSCDNGSTLPNVVVDPGVTVTCTFTNTKTPTEPVITLGTALGNAGSTVSVPINFTNYGGVTGITFGFSFDNSCLTFERTTNPQLLSPFQCEAPGAGNALCIIGGSPIPSTVVATYEFTLVDSPACNGRTFDLTPTGGPVFPICVVGIDPVACSIVDGSVTNSSPLAVELSYVYGSYAGGIVNFAWETATESGDAGFNIYTAAGDVETQITPQMVPSIVIDSVAPTAYAYQASIPADADRFFIEMVDIHGGSERYGPFEFGTEYGSSVVPGNAVQTPILWVPFVVQ